MKRVTILELSVLKPRIRGKKTSKLVPDSSFENDDFEEGKVIFLGEFGTFDN